MRWLPLLLALGCAPVDVSGTWAYDWQVREDGGAYEGWDGHFRGTLTLEQRDDAVTGVIGYPDEDPATLFGDARLRDLWTWPVNGTVSGDVLQLFAPAPLTAWDDDWRFVLTVDGDAMAGPSYAGASDREMRGFSAVRPR
jgi:hypothetical protein